MKKLPLVCVLFAVPACGGSEDDGSGNATDESREGMEENDDAEEPEPSGTVTVTTRAELAAEFGIDVTAIESLLACESEFSEAELAASAKLAYETDASIHELIACGGLTVRIAIGLVTGVVGMVLDAEDALPGGLSYEGEGVYLSESRLGDSSMEMRVRLYEEVDGEFVLIEDDLFDAKNYLTGVEVDADASADVDIDLNDPFGSNIDAEASVTISYESAGPWAKLLGLGDPPPNPIELGTIAEIHPDFGNIYMETEIDVLDVRDDTVVHYLVTTERKGLVEVFDSGSLTYEIVELDATNGVLGQTLRMDSWEVDFSGHAQLNGDVRFSVEADAEASLGYDAVLEYREAAYAEVRLTCAE